MGFFLKLGRVPAGRLRRFGNSTEESTTPGKQPDSSAMPFTALPGR